MEIDIYLTIDARTMTQIYLGDTSFQAAVADRRVSLVGPTDLTRGMYRCFARSRFADTPPASTQERNAMAPAVMH